MVGIPIICSLLKLFQKRASFRNALGTNVRTSGTNMDDYFKELEAVWETKAYTKKWAIDKLKRKTGQVERQITEKAKEEDRKK